MSTVTVTDPRPDSESADRKNFMLMVWCGPASIITVLLGWMVLAGFLPPPSPALSPAEAVAVWQNHTTLKRVGLIMCVWGGTLYVPFSIAIMIALRRGEPGRRILSAAQAALGTFGTVFFTLPFFILAMTPYRVDTAPSGIGPLHDLGFAMTFAPVAPFTFQYLLIGMAVLQDRATPVVFPRWVGYANFCAGFLLVPACLIPLFQTGPLAWNGVFSFWIPVIEFTAWFFLMVWALRRDAGQAAAHSTG
jgi:hypothetical protein